MALEESILTGTKKMLNVGADDESFDHDIITHINTAFSHLQQLGIGPSDGFAIEDATAKWSDFIQGPLPMATALQSNVAMRVRTLFDPPTIPQVATSLKEQLLESDVRLSIMREEAVWVAEHPVEEVVEVLEG